MLDTARGDESEAQMTISVTLEVQGLDALIRRFGTSNLVVREEAGDALEKGVALLHRKIAGYSQNTPSKPPGSTYDRTFTLARTFTHRVERSKFLGQVGTNLHYGPYVMSKSGQAAIHRGRWYTVESVGEEQMPTIEGYFAVATENIVRRLAG